MSAPTVERKSAHTAFYKSAWFIALLLAVFTLLVYAPVRQCQFTNYDDQDYVTANDHVKAGLTWPGIKWAFTSGFASNWHPLTWLSHMLDAQLFGLNAAAHHWHNVILHALTTGMLFLLLYRATAALWLSALVAALFAWHPMHVESVAWIAERKDVLSGFFAVATLWFYVRYAERRNGATGKIMMAYVGVVMCFALGLMSKPMLVTLPFVMLLLDFWPLARFDHTKRSKLLLEKMPLFLLAGASSVITFIVQHHSGAVRNLEALPIDSRILNVFVSYWRYLGKLFWPVKLAVFYPLGDWISGWLGVVSAILLLVISSIVFWRRRQMPPLFVGWFWFIGMLVPVIGIVQVGAQAFADRYSYLPSIGLFIAVAWSCAFAVRRFKPQWLLAFVGIVLLATCIGLTERQLSYWRNTTTLFRHALEVTENNFVAHINLGNALIQQKAWDEALSEFEQGIALRDDMFEAHYGAAMVLERKGQPGLALDHYKKAVTLRPDHADVRNNVASLLLASGRVDEAIAELKAGIALDPTYAPSHYNLGLALSNRDRDQAIHEYVEAIRLRADYADARNNLAVILAGKGKFEEAAEQLREVVKLRPEDAEANYNLSFVLSKMGRLDESKNYRETAFRLDPNLAEKK